MPTLQELRERHEGQSPKKVVQQRQQEQRTFSARDIQRREQTQSRTQGNQFEQQEPEGFLGKARDFATSILGGGKLAQGAAQAIGAENVLDTQQEETQQTAELADRIIQRIRAKRQRGEDTSRLEAALQDAQSELQVQSDTAQDFEESLVSNKQVIGSGARLAALAGGGALAGGVTRGASGRLAARGAERAGGLSQALGANRARTFGQGVLRGLGVGAATGAIEGGAQGAGLAAEQDASAGQIALAGGAGALGGAATGGAIGGLGGGFTARARGASDTQGILERVTPKADELTSKEYRNAVKAGRVIPKTRTQPDRYVLSQPEQETALKYRGLLKESPVETAENIGDQIGALDDQVGTFLRANNSIFNKGELRNRLAGALRDVDDVTIDQSRLQNTKDRIVNQFVESLEKNDMETLWKRRKEFDRTIENAFSGAPSAQKQVKRELRNAVQNFIAERTPEEIYTQNMRDMSNLMNLLDNVAVKASKSRGTSRIGEWIKENPRKAEAIGWTALGFGTGAALSPFRGGDGSSGG